MTAINSRCGVLVALVQDVPAEVVLLAAGQETHLRSTILLKWSPYSNPEPRNRRHISCNLTFMIQTHHPGEAGLQEPESLVEVVPGDLLRLGHDEDGLVVAGGQRLPGAAVLARRHREVGVRV